MHARPSTETNCGSECRRHAQYQQTFTSFSMTEGAETIDLARSPAPLSAWTRERRPVPRLESTPAWPKHATTTAD